MQKIRTWALSSQYVIVEFIENDESLPTISLPHEIFEWAHLRTLKQ